MTYKTSKSILHWTEKHEQFCLKNAISPSARLLWQWLIKNKYFIPETIDLKEFNQWVKKHRAKGTFCNRTIKNAFNELEENRIINLFKRFSWSIVKIVTRPLEYLLPRKKVQIRDIFSNLPSSKPTNFDTYYQQQQQLLIIENQKKLSEVGIFFNSDEIEVLGKPHNEILLAIECFKIRGGFKKIPNPPGWIRVCLRKRFWEESFNLDHLTKMYGHTKIWDELFPDIE